MKNNILTVALLLMSATASAQFTNGNAPEIGTELSMYEVDTAAPSYANVTGDNVTWDYSAYTGNNGATRSVSVVDPSSTENAATFAYSEKAIEIEDFFVSYFSETASGRRKDGMVYPTDGFGNLALNFTASAADVYTYPMGLNDALTGPRTGTAEVDIFGNASSGDINGAFQAKVDGSGTLKLAENTYENVLRYKMEDSLSLNFTQYGNIPGDVLITQYEYYDFSVSELPIFVYAEYQVMIVGGPAINFTEEGRLILSYDDPANATGDPNDPSTSIDVSVLNNIAVYPNPATEMLTIDLPSSVENLAVELVDMMGRTVLTTSVNTMSSTINVAEMNRGKYLLRLKTMDQVVVKNVIIQ